MEKAEEHENSHIVNILHNDKENVEIKEDVFLFFFVHICCNVYFRVNFHRKSFIKEEYKLFN